MKLNELGAKRQTEKIAKVMESHLGARVDFDRIRRDQARGLLNKVRAQLREHKASPSRHYSERNPDYLKLVMMEQALVSRLAEMDTTTGAAPVAGNQKVVGVDLKDPKIQATMKKAQAGQNLTPEEQKTVTAVASMQKESRRKMRESRRNAMRRRLSESEVQQAQVVMAVQDMVDRMQKMMEDISEMQFKDLPALSDSIKNDMGMEQASAFQSAASAALTQLLSAVQEGKAQMEQAQAAVTGQAPSVPGVDMGAPEDMDLGAGVPPEGDMDLGLDANLPPEGEEEELPPAAGLGRERR